MGNDNQLMDTGALNSGQDVTSDVDSQSPVKDSSKASYYSILTYNTN